MVPILFRKSLGCIILCCVVAATTSACVKLPRRHAHARIPVARTTPPPKGKPFVSINDAPREELEKLPGIGPALAARIVEHRQRYGRFRRAEHLLMVRGISESRFRQLRDFIDAE